MKKNQMNGIRNYRQNHHERNDFLVVAQPAFVQLEKLHRCRSRKNKHPGERKDEYWTDGEWGHPSKPSWDSKYHPGDRVEVRGQFLGYTEHAVSDCHADKEDAGQSGHPGCQKSQWGAGDQKDNLEIDKTWDPVSVITKIVKDVNDIAQNYLFKRILLPFLSLKMCWVTVNSLSQTVSHCLTLWKNIIIAPVIYEMIKISSGVDFMILNLPR